MQSIREVVDLGNDAAAERAARCYAQVAPATVEVVGSYEPGSGRFQGAYMTGPLADLRQTLELGRAALVAAMATV